LRPETGVLIGGLQELEVTVFEIPLSSFHRLDNPNGTQRLTRLSSERLIPLKGDEQIVYGDEKAKS
jgi:hypothetical protein